jgi:hypothetical protein
MNLFGHKIAGFAKVLVVLSAVFLVSSGLCGMEMFVANHRSGGDGTLIVLLGVAGAIGILLSAAGIVLLLIAWGLRAIFQGGSK